MKVAEQLDKVENLKRETIKKIAVLEVVRDGAEDLLKDSNNLLREYRENLIAIEAMQERLDKVRNLMSKLN